MNLTSMQLEVENFVVDTIFLEIAPTDIELDGTLFYDGLGLDSIDSLELALEISKNYGFEMSAEDEDNENIFASLKNLAEHIVKNSNRTPSWH